MRLGALEAGGTKMVLAIGNEHGEIFEKISIPTKNPSETIPSILDYFQQKSIDALGIGCFGPIDLSLSSKTYGYITSTPKIAWSHYDFVGNIEKTLRVPIGFDTDVNASVLGEVTWGSLMGQTSGIYITVGTGIGVGVLINGELLHGMLHPEAGHILLNRNPEDNFNGICPFHKNCLESLASGPAIEKRCDKKAYDIPVEDKVWEIEAYYLAQGIVNFILTYSPHRIVLGGGVMHQEQLFPLIRNQVRDLLNDYIITPQLSDLEHYIVPAALKDSQGIMGCLQLAKLAL